MKCSAWMSVAGFLLFLGVVAGVIRPAGAAELFLKIDGIPGESIDAAHTGEIDVLSWLVQQDLTVTKTIDKATPLLYRHLATGEHIRSAELTVRTAGATPLEIFKIMMADVLVTSISDKVTGSVEPLSETLTLNSRNIAFFYTPDGRGITPPIVTNPGPLSNAEGDAVSLQVVATAPFVEGLKYSASGLPPGLSISSTSGLLAGVISAGGAGVYSTTLTATDPGGMAGSATFSWTVIPGRPKITGSVATKGWASAGVLFVDVKLSNSGTGIARNILIKQVVLRTLSGTGTVVYGGPSLSLLVGDLVVGASTTVRMYFNPPAGVTRFSMTENGSVQDIRGAMFNYSIGQAVIP